MSIKNINDPLYKHRAICYINFNNNYYYRYYYKSRKVKLMGGIKKYSRKREAVLKKIRGTTAHPTADWVFEEVRKEIPDISLGTVYRNLSVFKDEGLIISVGVVGGQERFDANTKEHTHFICLGCGDVLDIESVESKDDTSLNERVSQKNGLDVMFRQLTFYGKCKKCSDK